MWRKKSGAPRLFAYSVRRYALCCAPTSRSMSLVSALRCLCERRCPLRRAPHVGMASHRRCELRHQYSIVGLICSLQKQTERTNKMKSCRVACRFYSGCALVGGERISASVERSRVQPGRTSGSHKISFWGDASVKRGDAALRSHNGTHPGT